MRSSSNADLTDLKIVEADVPRPDQLKTLVRTNQSLLLKATKRLAKINPRTLDSAVHSMHHQAFGFYDCLSCANCCRSISPAIRYSDVDNIARKLRIKPSEVVGKYLKTDSDGDYIFHSAPCPFIDQDNYCSIYSHRPIACREYPHTDRSRFYQLLKLSLKNAEICPVVYAILLKLSAV